MKKLLALLLIAVLLIPSPAAYADGAAQAYAEAERLLAAGDIAHAAMTFGRITGYKDAWERSSELWNGIAQHTIAAGAYHVAGVKEDGTVVALGPDSYGYDNKGQCNVADWRNIVAVAAGNYHTVGLRADGTVVAVGANKYGQCNVSGWRDIVAVAAGAYQEDGHTVGLRADGTVVAVGYNKYGQCDVSGWTDIVAVAAGDDHTVGLRSDGTVIAVGANFHGQCEVSGWTDIVAVAAGVDHTVGLRSDGTVVAVGNNYDGQCDVSGWTDIVAVAAGHWHTVGLRSDGTVVAVGYNKYGLCEVSGWTDIVAVAAGDSYTFGGYTFGLRSNGTVAATKYTGNFDYNRKNVTGWRNIKVPTARSLTLALPSNLDPSSPDGHFNYAILENEPGYLYDRFDDYWTWYAAYDEVYADADVIIGVQLEGEVGGSDPVGATLYTKIMDKDGRTIDGVQSMIFLIDDVKYSFNEMPGEDGAMAGSAVLYKDGYEIVKAFAEAKEVSVKLKLFSGKSIILDLDKAEFNRTLGNMCKKIVAYNVWDYYLENPGVEMLEMMFPLEITRK